MRIATRLWAGKPGNRGSFPSRAKRVSLLHNAQASFEAHPSSYPMVAWDSFQGVKRQVSETDHSPPSSAEVKNGGAMPPLPIRLHNVAPY
jgi:hypothetical protein